MNRIALAVAVSLVMILATVAPASAGGQDLGSEISEGGLDHQVCGAVASEPVVTLMTVRAYGVVSCNEGPSAVDVTIVQLTSSAQWWAIGGGGESCAGPICYAPGRGTCNVTRTSDLTWLPVYKTVVTGSGDIAPAYAESAPVVAPCTTNA